MAETKFSWWLFGAVFGMMAAVIGFYVWIYHEPEKVVVKEVPEHVGYNHEKVSPLSESTPRQPSKAN